MPKTTKRSLRRQEKRTARTETQTALLGKLLQPVDPEKFKFAIQAYSAAASMQMPTESLEGRPAVEVDGNVLTFADTPLTRGLTTISKELREAGVSDPMPYMWRVTQFCDIMKAKERFELFLKSNDSGQVSISEALLQAAAVARIIHDPAKDQVAYDLDDVLRIAQEYAAKFPESVDAKDLN